MKHWNHPFIAVIMLLIMSQAKAQVQISAPVNLPVHEGKTSIVPITMTNLEVDKAYRMSAMIMDSSDKWWMNVGIPTTDWPTFQITTAGEAKTVAFDVQSFEEEDVPGLVPNKVNDLRKFVVVIEDITNIGTNTWGLFVAMSGDLVVNQLDNDAHNDWKPGDIITMVDAAAITPPAYALPPGVHPAYPDGIFFGDMFAGVTEYQYTHQAMYIGNGLFLGADGIGGVYTASSDFMLSRPIGEYQVHRFNAYSIVPAWFPPCLADVIRQIVVNHWIDKAGEYLGQPYDVGLQGRSFLLGNDAKYCSELIWQGFKDAWGVELCPPVLAANLNYDPWAFLLMPMGALPDQGIITLDGLIDSPYLKKVYGPEEEPEDPDGC